jgi:hypothetical protein
VQTNLDPNLIIEALSEKVNQLTTENILQQATIKQLVGEINNLTQQKPIQAQTSKKDK